MDSTSNGPDKSSKIILSLRPFRNQPPRFSPHPQLSNPAYIKKQLDGMTWIIGELLTRLDFFDKENKRVRMEVEHWRAEAERVSGELTYAQVIMLEGTHQALAGRGAK